MSSSISEKTIRPSASSRVDVEAGLASAARSQSARPASERWKSQPLRFAPSA